MHITARRPKASGPRLQEDAASDGASEDVTSVELAEKNLCDPSGQFGMRSRVDSSGRDLVEATSARPEEAGRVCCVVEGSWLGCFLKGH